MLKKNEEYIVDVIDNGFQGEGIAKIDGVPIFISNGIKGEKLKIKIVKVLSSHGFGKILANSEFATALKAGDPYSLAKRVEICQKFVKEFLC